MHGAQIVALTVQPLQQSHSACCHQLSCHARLSTTSVTRESVCQAEGHMWVPCQAHSSRSQAHMHHTTAMEVAAMPAHRSPPDPDPVRPCTNLWPVRGKPQGPSGSQQGLARLPPPAQRYCAAPEPVFGASFRGRHYLGYSEETPEPRSTKKHQTVSTTRDSCLRVL